MNNNIETYFVDYPSALKLKKIGFDVACDLYFEWYPHYNGEPISFDEECELKDEGKSSLITYKELVQRMYNTNSNLKYSKNCSCPEIYKVADWILENYNIFIDAKPYWCEDGMMWLFEVYYLMDTRWKPIKCITAKETKIHALADGIEYVLDLIVTNKIKIYGIHVK